MERFVEDFRNRVGGPSSSARNSQHDDESVDDEESDEESRHAYVNLEIEACLADYPKRTLFCRWLLDKHAENPQFTNEVLICGEVCFTFEGIQNFNRGFYWYEPQDTRREAVASRGNRLVIESPMFNNFNTEDSVNLWAGILNGTLIGPFELPPGLNSGKYLKFLKSDLPTLLDDVPLDLRQRMWLLHENEGEHMGPRVRKFLKDDFGERWIGNKRGVSWPGGSTDLHPIYYFFWVHLGIKVYAPGKKFTTVEELRHKITECCDIIRNERPVLDNLSKTWMHRVRLCADTRGGDINHLL